MKVYEVIAELMKRPAGDEFIVAHNGDSYRVNSVRIESDEGMTYVIGDGRYAVTDDDECPDASTRKRA